MTVTERKGKEKKDNELGRAGPLLELGLRPLGIHKVNLEE